MPERPVRFRIVRVREDRAILRTYVLQGPVTRAHPPGVLPRREDTRERPPGDLDVAVCGLALASLPTRASVDVLRPDDRLPGTLRHRDDGPATAPAEVPALGPRDRDRYGLDGVGIGADRD